MSQSIIGRSLVVAFVAGCVAGPAGLYADDVDAGDDFFGHSAGNGGYDFDVFSGTWFDFGPPIGLVDFEGVSFDFGGTDTIIRRLDPVEFPGGGTIDIEIVALSLRSIDPVDIGGDLFDVTLQLDPVEESTGTSTFEHPEPDTGDSFPEGTFTSELTVWLDVLFVPVLGGTGAFQIDLDALTLTSSATAWSHGAGGGLEMPDGFGLTATGSGVGGFFAMNTVPAPGGVALLGVGGLLASRRRR